MEPLLLRPTEVAEALGLSRSLVYELIQAGLLESVKVNNARRVPREAVERYVESLRADAVTTSQAAQVTGQ